MDSMSRLDEALEALIEQLASDIRAMELLDRRAAQEMLSHAAALMAERGELALRRLEDHLGLKRGALRSGR